MGAVAKIKTWLGIEQKSAQPMRGLEIGANGVPVFWPLNFGAYTYDDRNFAEFVANGYGRNPYVFMVIDKIAQLIANLPLILCDDEEEIIEAPELMELLKNPSIQESGAEFIYRVISSYLATGNAIIYETTAIGFGQPSSLECAIVQDVEIRTDTGTLQGIPVTYDINYVGNIPADRVLHIKRPNILYKSVWGLSSLHSGQKIYTASNNTFTAQASIHDNRGASGIVSSASADIPMQPKERDEVQRQFQINTAGAHNTGINYVSSVPMQYTAIGMNATDLRLLEHNIQSLRDVCSLFGVDSSLFNDPANKTYNNRKEAQKALYTDVVLPLANDVVYEQLTEWLVVGMFGIDGLLKVDTSGIDALQEDRNEQHTRVNADVSAGIITAEEARMILYPELGNKIESNDNQGT